MELNFKITATDYFLLPFVLLLVFIIAIYFRNKYYPPKDPLRKYFVWGFTLKIFGALFVGLVYNYYYDGGDTMNYWAQTVIMNSSSQESLKTWFRLVTGLGDYYDVDIYPYARGLVWYQDPAEHIVSAIAAIIGMFTLTTYLPTAVIFAALSFIGVWKMFIVFTKLYPRLTKQMAIAFLFIPSVFVWGSGILKDTITLSCIGWLVHFFYKIFYENRKIVTNSILAFIVLFITYKIKSYIAIAFLPAALLWGVGLLSYKIRDARLIIVMRYFLYACCVFGMVIVGGKLQKEYIEGFVSQSVMTSSYLYRVSQEMDGSGYTLGDMDPTLLGMIQRAPAGVNVTLFRPYPWEARKPIVMMSALEALFFLGFTIAVIFRNNPLRVVQRIMGDETLQFCLIFTLIFAFAVGISTSNFGSLSRYKIPCMPFYTAFLFILFYPPKEALVLRKQRDKKTAVAV